MCTIFSWILELDNKLVGSWTRPSGHFSNKAVRRHGDAYADHSSVLCISSLSTCLPLSPSILLNSCACIKWSTKPEKSWRTALYQGIFDKMLQEAGKIVSGFNIVVLVSSFSTPFSSSGFASLSVSLPLWNLKNFKCGPHDSANYQKRRNRHTKHLDWQSFIE